VRRSIAVATLACALAGLIGGCGVRPTGVVDAGVPAQGVADQSVLRLYFVDGRQVRPVPRGDVPTGDPALALKLLMAGPDEREIRAGFRTDVPDGMGVLDLRVTDRSITITVDVDMDALSELALVQISCTLIAARTPRSERPRPSIVLVGDPGPNAADPQATAPRRTAPECPG
jgi:Sporulation and spore germination